MHSLPPPNQNTSQYENSGNAHVQGIEMETKVDIIRDNYIFMNYTFQNTNLSTFVSGRRSREEGDDRDDLPA